MSINNNNKKVLLFGSFTEDDIRSWQDEKPVKKKELKFDSLNCPTGITFGNFNGELSSQRGSIDGKVNFGSANSAKKEKEKDVKLLMFLNCAKKPLIDSDGIVLYMKLGDRDDCAEHFVLSFLV
ncbi:uncharacterized protein LOC130015251 [Mercurialis annua]|uniref:uncharacterized protein LOC130015251 n=1 Tax=Mercurialis annua TaxID=3986 RepID=UPI0024ADE0A9|nr:uncharacterized protein LOC130015251 [Mercurialis annua]